MGPVDPDRQGLTPFPYKVLTIASGACVFNISPVRPGASIARAMRFYLVAALYWFGEPIRDFVERVSPSSRRCSSCLVGGFVAVRYVF